MNCFGRRQFNRHVKIILLDDQEIIQEVQRLTKGQDLLDVVFKHLNVIETSYFGLRFIDNMGQAHWVDPGKSVVKQISGTDPASFYFGVKFYAADPCKLYEEITRYLFFLQIKRDILDGRLNVPDELAAQLGALAVQSELGDYDPKRHGVGYVSEFRFVENQSAELESRICELHKTMIGDVPAIAELNYLERVKWLDMYGVDLHPVLGEDKIDYFLGLAPSGIIVLRNKNKVGNYFWPRITKMSMKGKYFMLRVKNRAEEETYGFETPSKAACKHLWKSAMDHHTFFRLVQVTPTAGSTNNNNRALSLNNRFRGSNHSNISSASRRRAQPQFIRTSSRRYVRRFVEGSEVKTENYNENNHLAAVTHEKNENMQSTAGEGWRANSPKSIRSVPVCATASCSVPSPRSQRPRKRTQSVESYSSCEETTHRRHRNSRSLRSRKHRHSHSSSRHKQSDGESEVSAASLSSSKKRHRQKSRHYDNSGSESDHQHHRRRRHRQRASSSDVIEWKEATVSTVQQSHSSVKVLAADPDSQSIQGRLSVSRHQSGKSSSGREPNELKKYFHYELIDTDGMSREELDSLPYTSVMTSRDPAVSMKNRVLLRQRKQRSKQQSDVSMPNQSHDDNSCLQAHYLSTSNVTESKTCAKGVDNEGDNSPPPPYSPPSDEHLRYSLLPKGVGGQQSAGGKSPSLQTHDSEFVLSSATNQRYTPSKSGRYYGAGSGRYPEPLMKEHPENSDSGLGTDREYCRENVLSSLSYGLPDNVAAPQRPTGATVYQRQPELCRERTRGGSTWAVGPQYDARNNEAVAPQVISGNLDVQNRSSSLEMILSPLVSSTTNRTRL